MAAFPDNSYSYVNIYGWQEQNFLIPNYYVPRLPPQSVKFIIQVRVNKRSHWVVLSDGEEPRVLDNVVEPMFGKFFTLNAGFLSVPNPTWHIHEILSSMNIRDDHQMEITPYIMNLLVRVASEVSNAGRPVLSVVFEVTITRVVPYDDDGLAEAALEDDDDDDDDDDDEPAPNIVAPASEPSIKSLQTIRLTGSGSASLECVICYEEFADGMEVTQMPCNHIFHGECIIQWLNINHSCPLCRFGLPTDRN